MQHSWLVGLISPTSWLNTPSSDNLNLLLSFVGIPVLGYSEIKSVKAN